MQVQFTSGSQQKSNELLIDPFPKPRSLFPTPQPSPTPSPSPTPTFSPTPTPTSPIPCGIYGTPICSGHGTCVDNTCKCDEKWKGDDCSLEIKPTVPKPDPEKPVTNTTTEEDRNTIAQIN
eukprot:gene8568-10539_t